MGNWSEDIYYYPEKHGLEKVGGVEWEEPDYSFDLTAVWYDRETGTFYWGSDSGCSCPTPFEDITDKTKLFSGTFHEAAAALQTILEEEQRHAEGNDWSRLSKDAPMAVVHLIERMRDV